MLDTQQHALTVEGVIAAGLFVLPVDGAELVRLGESCGAAGRASLKQFTPRDLHGKRACEGGVVG